VYQACRIDGLNMETGLPAARASLVIFFPQPFAGMECFKHPLVSGRRYSQSRALPAARLSPSASTIFALSICSGNGIGIANNGQASVLICCLIHTD
tara:strand:+ start:3151 stop:3438 length:288 start_codon:yes stop_codon:yes gene_type:complete